MKKIILASVVGLVMLGLVACGTSKDKENDEVANVSVKDIITDFKEKIAKDIEDESGDNILGEDGTLSGYTEADLKDKESEDPFTTLFLERAELDPEKLEEGRFLAPMINVNSTEIIILKAKDAADIDELKAALEREQAVQVGIWEQYLPDQHEKVKKNVIKVNGNYLLFATSDDSAALEKIFDEKLK